MAKVFDTQIVVISGGGGAPTVENQQHLLDLQAAPAFSALQVSPTISNLQAAPAWSAFQLTDNVSNLQATPAFSAFQLTDTLSNLQAAPAWSAFELTDSLSNLQAAPAWGAFQLTDNVSNLQAAPAFSAFQLTDSVSNLQGRLGQAGVTAAYMVEVTGIEASKNDWFSNVAGCAGATSGSADPLSIDGVVATRKDIVIGFPTGRYLTSPAQSAGGITGAISGNFSLSNAGTVGASPWTITPFSISTTEGWTEGTSTCASHPTSTGTNLSGSLQWGAGTAADTVVIRNWNASGISRWNAVAGASTMTFYCTGDTLTNAATIHARTNASHALRPLLDVLFQVDV